VPQAGLGLGVQAPGLNNVTSATLQQQPNNIHQQSNQQALMSAGPKDAGIFHCPCPFIVFNFFYI
jgi:CCR4-NOT transcription complex subunit 3